MVKKIFSLFSILIIVGVMFTSNVSAQDDTRIVTEEIDINFKSAYSDVREGTKTNLASDTTTESDTWPIPVKGRYWGPYIPVSVISLKPDQIISFTTEIELGADVMAYGISEYWIRIPVVGTNIQSLSMTINGNRKQPFQNIPSDDMVWSSRGIFIKWRIPIQSEYNGGVHTFTISDITPNKNTPVQLMITQEYYLVSETQIINIISPGDITYTTDLGVPLGWAFVFLKGLSKTGLYSFDFNTNFRYKDNIYNETPEAFENVVLITLEEDVSFFDFFVNYKYLNGIVKLVRTYQNVYYGTTGIWQRTAINTWQKDGVSVDPHDIYIPAGTYYVTIDSSGWKHYLYSGGDDPFISPEDGRYIYYYGQITPWTNGKYITITMPFVGTSAFDIIFKYWPSGATNNSYYVRTQEFENYLLYTIPAPTTLSSGSILEYQVYIIPHNNITLLAYDVNPETNFKQTWISTQGYYNYETVKNGSPAPTYRTKRYFATSIMLTVEMTDGVVVYVTQYPEYLYYDFGWGVGYQYPGDLVINIQLDYNTSIMFRGRTELFYNAEEMLLWYDWEEGSDIPPPEEGSLVSKLVNHFRKAGGGIKNIGGDITGVITTIWEGIKALFSWIYDILIEFMTKVWVFLKELITYISFQLYGLVLTVCSFAVLFITGFFISWTESSSKKMAEIIKNTEKFFIGKTEKLKKEESK